MKKQGMDIVRSAEELKRRDGQQAEVAGRYCAVERPMKGIVRKPRPKDHALLLLDDGAHVFLEPFDSPASQRPGNELGQFDGKRVRVTGILYHRMPAHGESPIAPCIAEIAQIREET
jgi:hypothetical protein